jgi:hypothetical protein
MKYNGPSEEDLDRIIAEFQNRPRETVVEIPVGTLPKKVQKRRQHFIKVPWVWLEQLDGATGETYRVALCLLYLHWKAKGRPIKLANGMLRVDGVSRQTKWRALRELERRDLISVECRPGKSPIIRVQLFHP